MPLPGLEAEAQAKPAAPRRRVRLEAPMSLVPRHVAPVPPEFLSACPGISVDLIAGGIDIALRIAGLPDSSLSARRLREARRWVVWTPAGGDAGLEAGAAGDPHWSRLPRVGTFPDFLGQRFCPGAAPWTRALPGVVPGGPCPIR